MAINIGENSGGNVTYQNPPIDRTLFPNLCNCDTIKSEIEKLNQEIENIINSAYVTETITDAAVASFTDGADGHGTR